MGSGKLNTRLTLALLATALAACSKSPIDCTVEATNAAAKQLMAPLVEKDASRQVERLIRTIDQRPECARYIQSLRDVGHHSPYEGATQWAIGHTYEAAGKAGCVKEN